jgi:hypothetical protein
MCKNALALVPTVFLLHARLVVDDAPASFLKEALWLE